MNILRTIKLKHLNGELDNMTKKEKLFVNLFNGATENRFRNSIHITKDDKTIFTIGLSTNSFWCEYESILDVFKVDYRMNYEEMESFINHILHEHFGFNNLTYSQYRPAGVYVREVDTTWVKL